MGLLKNLGGAVASGLMGNLSEMSPEALTQEYVPDGRGDHHHRL